MFNLHPAKVFAGDTGSLLLRRCDFSISIIFKNAIIISCDSINTSIRNAICYYSSGIFQKDRNRILKWHLLHHHFELSGWKEKVK